MKSLFTVNEWRTKDNMPILLGDLHHTSQEEKLKHNFISHRERAFAKASKRIKELLL